MVDVDLLKRAIAGNGLTNRELAQKMGCSEATLYNKFRTGVFNSNEIEFLIEELHIQEPWKIFFAEVVASQATNETDKNEPVIVLKAGT